MFELGFLYLVIFLALVAFYERVPGQKNIIIVSLVVTLSVGVGAHYFQIFADFMRLL